MFKRWLEPPKSNFLLLGPRRAGKTTFLKDNYPDYTYVTLDDLDFLGLAERDPKGLLERSKRMIIDEVQRVPRLTIAVKNAMDNLGAKIILSGSSRVGLLDAAADTLAGRIKILDLPTACWGEPDGPPTHSLFSEEADPLQLKSSGRALDDAIRFGGFPEVVTRSKAVEKVAVLKNYRDTYFTRDLAMLSNLSNVSGLLAILNHFAVSIGSLTQVSRFRDESGLSHPTAQKYLQGIYQSGLGFQLLGYQFGPAKRYLKAGKSYFADNGILTSLKLPLSRGQWLENFVISEVEKRRKLGLIESDQLFYYQSIGGAEIDLIFEEDDRVTAVEIKSSRSLQSRDVRNLRDFVEQAPKKRRGFVFYLGDEYLPLQKGIRAIPVGAIYRSR